MQPHRIFQLIGHGTQGIRRAKGEGNPSPFDLLIDVPSAFIVTCSVELHKCNKVRQGHGETGASLLLEKPAHICKLFFRSIGKA